MVAVVSKNIMQQARIAIESEGELVVMKFGNTEIKVHYEAAFQISQWIRVRAKEAKRRAGDTSLRVSLLGTLHDANVTRG